MFNVNLKNQFLLELNNEEKRSYQNIFGKTSDVEQQMNKDLFDFNLSEIEELNLSCEEMKLTCNYINWAIEQGFKENNVNPLFLLIDDEEDEE